MESVKAGQQDERSKGRFWGYRRYDAGRVTVERLDLKSLYGGAASGVIETPAHGFLLARAPIQRLVVKPFHLTRNEFRLGILPVIWDG